MNPKEQRRFDYLYEQMLQDLVLPGILPETGALLHFRGQKPDTRGFVRRRFPPGSVQQLDQISARFALTIYLWSLVVQFTPRTSPAARQELQSPSSY